VVIAGTGSVGLAIIGGREVRIGGYGFPVSDGGSGAALGLGALRVALKAYDGRLANTPLASEMMRRFRDDPLEVIAWTGKDNCLKPFVEIVHVVGAGRMTVAAYDALSCAKLDAVIAIAEALPQDRDLDPGAISHYFWDKIVAFGPASAAPARKLLESSSWVAKLTGIAVLDKVGMVEDAGRVRALAGDKTPLRGFGRTLGQEAKAVADRLERKR